MSAILKVFQNNEWVEIPAMKGKDTPQIDDTHAYQTNPWSGYKTNNELEKKINEPSSEGTSGQVLSTNGNGGRYWVNKGSNKNGLTWEECTDNEFALTALNNLNISSMSFGFNSVTLNVSVQGINHPAAFMVFKFSNDKYSGLLLSSEPSVDFPLVHFRKGAGLYSVQTIV